MPQLWSPAFLRNVPLPLLQIYSLTSCILLCCALYQAVAVVTGQNGHIANKDIDTGEEIPENLDPWEAHMNKYLMLNSTDVRLSEQSHKLIAQSVPLKLLFYLVTEPLCCCYQNIHFYVLPWVNKPTNVAVIYNIEIVLNAVCCFIITCTNFARWLVFGKLRTAEMMVVSTASSASGRQQLYRTLVLMAACCGCACALLGVAFCMATTLGTNYGALLAADALTLWVRSVYGALRYAAVLYEQGRERNLSRMEFVYYADLCFTLATLLIEFVHLLHMLIWSNIVLSVVSLVIGVQLRQIWSEIDSCLRRHKNHRRVMAHLNKKYPIASRRELSTLDDDTCAICWESLSDSARKLPCAHIFHHWCLQSWLEQDHSCPTCRVALAIDQSSRNNNNNNDGNNNNNPDEQGGEGAEVEQRRVNHVQHFFEFDGRRFSRWLPTFRVQVSHNLGQIFARLGHPLPHPGPVAELQYAQWVGATAQVREMFPHVPAHLIEADLRLTNHVNLTVENIIEERIWVHEQLADMAPSDDSDQDSDPTDIDNDHDNESDNGHVHGINRDHVGRVDAHLGQGPRLGQPVWNVGAYGDAFGAASSQGTSHTLDPQMPSTSNFSETQQVALSSATSSAQVFAATQNERQSLLVDSKRRMVDVNRRRYLISSRANDLHSEREYWLGKDYINILAPCQPNNSGNAPSSNGNYSKGSESVPENSDLRQRKNFDASSVQRLL